MSVRIEFDTENAAFDDPQAIEHTIREVLDRIGEGNEPSGTIIDINGNRIGTYDTMAEPITEPEPPRDTSYNGWTNYETWCLKLWQDNEQGENERWRDAAKNAESQGTLADQMHEEYEDAVPETTGVWSDLLSSALGEVDWFEIAEHLIEEVKENTRYEIEKIVKAGGSTSTDTEDIEGIVEGIEDLLPGKMLEEFQEAYENKQSELFDDICNYLEEVAPEDITFGTHPGDSMCWGFWKIEDDEEED